MPVIKSAKKKLRKDKNRERRNSTVKLSLNKALKMTIKKPNAQNAKTAIKLTDKASKKGIIHKNKANRIKSRLSKLLSKSTKKQTGRKTPKQTSSKAKK